MLGSAGQQGEVKDFVKNKLLEKDSYRQQVCPGPSLAGEWQRAAGKCTAAYQMECQMIAACKAPTLLPRDPARLKCSQRCAHRSVPTAHVLTTLCKTLGANSTHAHTAVQTAKNSVLATCSTKACRKGSAGPFLRVRHCCCLASFVHAGQCHTLTVPAYTSMSQKKPWSARSWTLPCAPPISSPWQSHSQASG